MPGIIAPMLRRDGSVRQPGEIDIVIVRENTEGEYSSIGGRMYAGTARAIVMQETVMSRIGVDRVLKFAFELAQSRPKKHLTSATRSNGIAITMPYWDERVAAMAKSYPERAFPSLFFEPAHGSSPDIAERAVANPIGQIWSGALMLDFLGFKEAHDAVLTAIEEVLAG